MVTLKDLTDYHRMKVMQRATDWRMANRDKVLEIVKSGCREHYNMRADILKAAEPTGTMIFDPSKWGPRQWMWFTEILCERLTKGTR